MGCPRAGRRSGSGGGGWCLRRGVLQVVQEGSEPGGGEHPSLGCLPTVRGETPGPDHRETHDPGLRSNLGFDQYFGLSSRPFEDYGVFFWVVECLLF